MVPLKVVQSIYIDVMQESSDIMPFKPFQTPVFDSVQGLADLEGLFGPICFPPNLTPILQDTLDNIGVVVEVLTLRVMMEGGV